MSISVGIGLAFVAMLLWGAGDFLIQKSTRRIGDAGALFFITLFGAVVLLPFAYKRIPDFIFGPSESLLVVGALCVVLLIAAVLDFEALRIGKLSVIEPIWSLEVPTAAVLAFFIIGERITVLQSSLVILLVIGLVLVSLKSGFNIRRFLVEKGVLLAVGGAVGMGAANFFMGWGARLSDPVMVNFISDLFIAAAVGAFLLFSGRMGKTVKDIVQNKKMLFQMSVSDKAAWLAFAFAMSVAPIAVVVALSESYIVIAVLLGLFVNREPLRLLQKVGLITALFAALILAAITV